MKFIDEITILAKAGNGGNGYTISSKLKHFSKTKIKGGNGGDGGNIWITSDSHLDNLSHLYLKKVFIAQNGQKGKRNNCYGKNGNDIYIKVPIGTIVSDLKHGNIIAKMDVPNKKFLIAKGGKHGLGINLQSKTFLKDSYSKRNQGNKGQITLAKLNFKIQADVGIFGMPNSGRSSFINSVSSAKPKIENYPFTTLYPTLGIVFLKDKCSFKIIDVPSIIQGSNLGKGLGINFLKHLEQCKILLHFVDISSESIKNILKNINNIYYELKNCNYNLINKDIWLVFSKTDLLEKKHVHNKIQKILELLKWSNKYFQISSFSYYATRKLCIKLLNYLNK